MKPLLHWPEHWRRKQIRVLLVGAGGTGSEVFDGLVRFHFGLQAFGHKGLDVTVVDDDVISAPNCIRQRFWPHEVGIHKSIALVNRANQLMNTHWTALPYKFTGDLLERHDLIISCTDNLAARKEIYKAGKKHNDTLWLDCGNGTVFGQVVLGHFGNKKGHIKNVIDLYPEILSEKDKPNRSSCSAAESLSRQSLCINNKIANGAINLLWQLLRKGSLGVHGLKIDAEHFEEVAIEI